MSMDETRMYHEKTAIRELAKTRLKGIEATAASAAGLAIAEAVTALDAFAKAGLVLAFLSMPSEIDTCPVIEKSLAYGKRVAVPRIEGTEIAFVELSGGWKAWPHDRWHIPVPPSSLPALSPLEILAQPCLALVPGLAFDTKRMRLGRGMGFYDRFLASMDAARVDRPSDTLWTCGIGFACQRFDRIPAGPHDHRLDAVLLV